MKQGIGRLIGLLSLYFIPLIHTDAQTAMDTEKVIESTSLSNPVYIQTFDLTESFGGKIQVINLDQKLDLKGYLLDWTIERIDAWNGSQLLFSDRIELANSTVDKNTEISLDLPTNWKDGDVLNLTLLGNDGSIIHTLSEPIRKPKEGNQNYFKHRSPLESQSILVRESTVDFQITAGENLYIFGKQKGNLELVKVGRRFINFSQTIEEGLFSSSVQNLTWKKLKDGSVQIKSTYQTNPKILAWTILPNGELKLEISSQDAQADVRRIGFSFPEEKLKYAQWIGDGSKEESEKPNFGLWKRSLKDLLADSAFDSDLKGQNSFIHALFLETEEGTIEVRSETPSVYLSLDKQQVKERPVESAEQITSASDLKFYFNVTENLPANSSPSNAVIPVNLSDNKEQLSSEIVMWFRFN